VKAFSGIATAALLGLASLAPANAREPAMETETLRSTARQLAFDPVRFFPDAYVRPLIAIRYTGDDYGYPVYSVAVYSGCREGDVGEARKTCGKNFVARMVRAPALPSVDGEPARLRWRGAAVFKHLYDRDPATEAEVRAGLDSYGLEWLEADITQCPAALVEAQAGSAIAFFAEPVLPAVREQSIVLHADKIELVVGGYLTRSRYYGFAKRGSPGAWAVKFAESLEDCWTPASATAPWLLSTPPEPELAERL
jgi:hypothetical protein